MPTRPPTWNLIRPSTCPRCQLRQNIRTTKPHRDGDRRWSSKYTRSSTTPGYFPPPSEIQQPAYAHLTNRSVIRLQGPDVVDFLNGLLPAKLQPLPKDNSTPIFTAFLSAKGRILHEAFIYPPTESSADQSWHIDVDKESQSAVFSHLKKHKLRSKFKLEKVPGEQLGVFYQWPGTNAILDGLGGRDPRPLMGQRFISNSVSATASDKDVTISSLNDYSIHRALCGHAEGPKELIANSALPQESNMDFSGGVDFHKGCYLGQELTIRTHHTGVVRKRILPCQIYPADQQLAQDQEIPQYDASVSVLQPPSEANISKKNARGRAGRSTGKWLGGVGNIGLALCRLEMMTDIQLTAEGTAFDADSEFTIDWEEGEADADDKTTLRQVRVKPFVPQWLRDSIEAGIKARSDRRKKRRQTDPEDEDDLD